MDGAGRYEHEIFVATSKDWRSLESWVSVLLGSGGHFEKALDFQRRKSHSWKA